MLNNHRTPDYLASLPVAFGILLAAFADAFSATGPCDIYLAGGTPCIAAHSTVRALYAAYTGPLYQVKRGSDSKTLDINAIAAGGAADGAAQDAFCKGTTCEVTFVYDQSGKGNLLESQTPSSKVGGKDNSTDATKEFFNLGGHKVYALYIKPANSFWRDGHTTGVPLGKDPEGVYMVTSGTHFNGGCCFDYGNSETTRKPDGAGAMDAIYFGTSCWFKGGTYDCSVSGTGPWVQADLEYGIFAWNSSKNWNPAEVSFKNPYVTAMLKNNGTTMFALKGGNAQSGELTTLWNGALPSGYNPMKKQGAIVLGSGGDCCATNTNQSEGTFYEGAIVAGYPTDATDAAVQANIVAAGYGNSTIGLLGEGSRNSRAASQAPYLFLNPSKFNRFSPPGSAWLNPEVLDLRGRQVGAGQASKEGESDAKESRSPAGAFIIRGR